MSARCLICGAEHCKGHHLTGRDPRGRYLDPRLAVPLDPEHHMLYHYDWRALGIQDSEQVHESAPKLTYVERVELRLRRGAVLAGRLAEAHPEWGWIAALARALKWSADELARDVATRDQRDPGWRSD